MTFRDLPYYDGIRAKTCHEYKLHENKYENHTNSLHAFRKWWPYFVPSGHSKHWLIHHSMASTAIYSLRDSDIIKMADQAWIAEV